MVGSGVLLEKSDRLMKSGVPSHDFIWLGDWHFLKKRMVVTVHLSYIIHKLEENLIIRLFIIIVHENISS